MEYYINVDNKKQGPYSLKELAGRKIEATTLVMASNSNEWQPAWQIDELRPILMGNANDKINKLEENPVVTGTPFNDIPHVEAQPIENVYIERPIQEKPKKHYGCLVGFLISFVALIFLLIFTCPSADDHKRVLSDVVTSTINDAETSAVTDTTDELTAKALQTFNDVFTKKIINGAIDNLVSVDNYFVGSVGKINIGGKSYIVSVGVLNHIFTLNKDQLKLAAEKYYKKTKIDVQSDFQKDAEKLLKEKVINPAQDKIKEMAGSVVDELLDGIGLSSGQKSSSTKSAQPKDSI